MYNNKIRSTSIVIIVSSMALEVVKSSFTFSQAIVRFNISSVPRILIKYLWYIYVAIMMTRKNDDSVSEF